MNIIIPKRIHIFATPFDIKWVDNLMNVDNAYGQISYHENLIKIQPSTKEQHRSPAEIEVTYLHEVIHLIFNKLNEFDLGKNEKLVDTMAASLHQILTTAEY